MRWHARLLRLERPPRASECPRAHLTERDSGRDETGTTASGRAFPDGSGDPAARAAAGVPPAPYSSNGQTGFSLLVPRLTERSRGGGAARVFRSESALPLDFRETITAVKRALSRSFRLSYNLLDGR